ncbi:hypothetical protein BJY21_000283 [Kineosphaera limosa]|uniref:Uncharacterized protein n=1 Tax=Kineosphaera limosa NBRC 100340 TaxID=1184609 RepID=K6WRS9_9MICO|nr:hypothetical protein [Kineosphaera limosa]NYD99098.1 hypothetical protein [Kineosphaera limosa]GAB96541.1 hypothetical protein KILIM_040_00500 [Kineosphaera limosa NBRC 100340]
MGEPGTVSADEPGSADVAQLAAQVRAHLDELAATPDPAAFRELLAISEYLGLALGTSARTLAAQGSWSRVAEQAGTTKQAAWSRWH